MRAHQDDERSQVPHEGQAGCEPRQVTALEPGPSAAAVEQCEKDGEDQRATGMAEDVDQKRLAKIYHCNICLTVRAWRLLTMNSRPLESVSIQRWLVNGLILRTWFTFTSALR